MCVALLVVGIYAVGLDSHFHFGFALGIKLDVTFHRVESTYQMAEAKMTDLELNGGMPWIQFVRTRRCHFSEHRLCYKHSDKQAEQRAFEKPRDCRRCSV